MTEKNSILTRDREIQKYSEEYEKLTFTDDFIFMKVMQNEDLCKRLLETILHIKIDHLEYVQNQLQLKDAYDSRGVRLDVYAKGSDTVYDIEMQPVKKKNLPKRSRYYQASIDQANMDVGNDMKYERLPESYVIFICMEDPFEAGLPYYKFENISEEFGTKVYLKDGGYKIFLNPRGEMADLDSELKGFLSYLLDGKTTTALTRDIDVAVRNSRKNKEWRMEYVMMSMLERDAKAEGREEERRNNIVLLFASGMTSEDIARILKLPLNEVQNYIDSAAEDTK